MLLNYSKRIVPSVLLLVPVLQTVGGTGVLGAALIGLLTGAIVWGSEKCLADYKSQLWLTVLQSAVIGIICAQLSEWNSLYWKTLGEPKLLTVILLLSAYWGALKGEKTIDGIVLIVGTIGTVLVGAVLLSAIPGIQIQNVSWTMGRINPELIFVLLLPLIYKKDKSSKWNAILASACAFILIGNLTIERTEKDAMCFYTLSKSIKLFGIAPRFESMAAVGVMLGFFSMLILFMRPIMGNRIYESVMLVTAGGVILSGVAIDGVIILLALLALWIWIPAGESIFRILKRKRKKYENNA